MIWYETEWPLMLDIDNVDIADPAPTPEETYGALEAWAATRRRMERAYGPARATVGTVEQQLAAIRQVAIERQQQRQLAVARREAAAHEAAEARLRFARDRAMEAARKPSRSREGFAVTTDDGTTYIVMAKSGRAALGWVLLDTAVVQPEHRLLPPDSFSVERLDIDSWSEGPGVLSVMTRAWLVPIQHEGRTLQCIVGAASKAIALQAVRDDTEVHDEWKSDDVFMQNGTTELSFERISWMRTADSNLQTMLAECKEPRVLGLLREDDATS